MKNSVTATTYWRNCCYYNAQQPPYTRDSSATATTYKRDRKRHNKTVKDKYRQKKTNKDRHLSVFIDLNHERGMKTVRMVKFIVRKNGISCSGCVISSHYCAEDVDGLRWFFGADRRGTQINDPD